jgi:cytochrome d ubiquinol oxidase subunit II
METIWFGLVAFMIAMYVVFDGFDLGAGAIHLIAGRSTDERRLILRSIGPVWDGNEVWLLAAGGVLFLAFPRLYASSFSGFYLPLMMVLWLLILRGLAVEFRNKLGHAVWIPFWDVVFSVASALLAVFYGAALGNVVRGVPLDSEGWFFAPLWTNFLPGAEAGVLDWYTVLVGLTALFALVQHGALWVAMKTPGELEGRARRLALGAWWFTAALTLIVTFASMSLQPQIRISLTARPWGFVFPILAVAGLLGVRWFASRRDDLKAFLASCAYLVGMLTSAAFGLYPYVLPTSDDSGLGLTVANSAAAPYGLWVGFLWFFPGLILICTYFVFTYRRFAGKVPLEPDAH